MGYFLSSGDRALKLHSAHCYLALFAANGGYDSGKRITTDNCPRKRIVWVSKSMYSCPCILCPAVESFVHSRILQCVRFLVIFCLLILLLTRVLEFISRSNTNRYPLKLSCYFVFRFFFLFSLIFLDFRDLERITCCHLTSTHRLPWSIDPSLGLEKPRSLNTANA